MQTWNHLFDSTKVEDFSQIVKLWCGLA